jgi:hypothetical protein
VLGIGFAGYDWKRLFCLVLLKYAQVAYVERRKGSHNPSKYFGGASESVIYDFAEMKMEFQKILNFFSELIQNDFFRQF